MNNEEQIKIMKMVQDGKISAEEGLDLLDLLSSKRSDPNKQEPVRPAGAVQPQWCRIRISDVDTGKVKVNVRLPLGLVNAGMKMGAKISSGMDEINFSEIIKAARSNEIGRLVDVYDDESREHTEIFLE